jgi:HAE1 family hydrophobic/amphiphilic exporter-1
MWTAKAKAALAELSKSFPPGLEYAIAFDSTTVVGDSIREVLVTLGLAVFIVITVIFLFLLDWRATIIPAVTIPVSLIGTFAFIKLFGFSINALTLFGITLATGLVVDDAIVVIENVQRHIAMEHSDPHEATSRAMGEVTSAVIATSLVLIAVFVPVSFFPGTTGILYRQFSLTIAFAIAISAFNALTLSPALSAMFLRGEEDRPKQLDFLHIARSRALLPNSFTPPTRRSVGCRPPTQRSIHGALKLRYAMLLLFLRRTGRDGMDLQPRSHRLHSPGGPELPDGDRAGAAGLFTGLHRRAGRPRTNAIIAPESRHRRSIFGDGLQPLRRLRQPGHDVHLDHALDQRRGKGHSTADIVADLNPKLQMLMFAPNGGIVQMFEPPAVNGVGSVGGFQFMLQDQGSNTLSDLDRVAHQITGASRARKDLRDLYTSFSANDPQVLVTIDREKAKAMSIPLSQITNTLSRLHGVGVHQRLRLQQSHLPRLCAG